MLEELFEDALQALNADLTSSSNLSEAVNQEFSSRVPTTTTLQLRDALIRALPDYDVDEVIDIGGVYGENFGLWTAAANSTINVRIQDPWPVGQSLPAYMTNGVNSKELFKLQSPHTPEGILDAEQIEHYLRSTGLTNVSFVGEKFTPEDVAALSERPFLHAGRCGDDPDIGYMIAGTSGSNPNLRYCITPYLRAPVGKAHVHFEEQMSTIKTVLERQRTFHNYDEVPQREVEMNVLARRAAGMLYAAVGNGQVISLDPGRSKPFHVPPVAITNIPNISEYIRNN